MPSTSRYLETEFADAQKYSDLKRQRHLHTAKQRAAGKTDCELCLEEFFCCSEPGCSVQSVRLLLDGCSFDNKSLASLLVYILFPLFAILDFALGLLAKERGWYEHCVGEMVCEWNASACAVWIAFALSALVVAGFALLGKLVSALWTCYRARRTASAASAVIEVI